MNPSILQREADEPPFSIEWVEIRRYVLSDSWVRRSLEGEADPCHIVSSSELENRPVSG